MRWLLLLWLVLPLLWAEPPPERKIPAWNFALTLRVGAGEWDAAITEMEALFEHAKEKAMGANTQLFLRGTLEKMKEKVAELEDALAKGEEARRREAEAPKPAAFTDKAIGVKPLKASMAAKKENVKRYAFAEAVRLAKANKLDLKKPFILKNALPELETFQTRLTAEELIKLSDVRINYLSPVIAKKKRTFDEKQPQSDEEQFEFQRISFESWFQECFNLKAKPDFRRMPGYGTEHCEQSVPAWLLPPQWLNLSLSATATLEMDGLFRMALARARHLADGVAEIQALVAEGREPFEAAGAGTGVRLTMGSAGSGEQLRREATGFMDALVSGRRRWFFIGRDSFEKLRDRAKGVLEPASAFQFFEQQFEELKEDFALGAKGLPFFECNQQAGEVLYIPPNLQRLALALEDSVSVTHEVSPNTPKALAAWVDDAVFTPGGGVVPTSYSAGVCFDYNVQRLAAELHVTPGIQEQVALQIMQQGFGHPSTEASIVLNVLTRCAGATAVPGVVELTRCPLVWVPCAAKLKALAASLKAPVPAWLRVELPALRDEL